MNEREFNVEDARLDVLVHEENVLQARRELDAVRQKVDVARRKVEANASSLLAEAQGVLNRELIWLEQAKARHASAKHALENFAD